MAQIAGSGYDSNSLMDLLQKAKDDSDVENQLPASQLTDSQQIAKQGGDLGAGAAMGSLGMAPGSLAEMIAAKEAQTAAPAVQSAASTALSNLATNGAAPAAEQAAPALANAIDGTPTLVKGVTPEVSVPQNTPSQYGNIKTIPSSLDNEIAANQNAYKGNFFDNIRNKIGANGNYKQAAVDAEQQGIQNTRNMQQQARQIRQDNTLAQQTADRKDIQLQQFKRMFGK